MKKVIVGSSLLKDALEKSLSCLSGNGFLAICDNVMLVADEEDTYIEVTDVKNYIKYPVPFNYDTPGSFLISHIELQKYLKLLPECPVILEHDPVNTRTLVLANDEKAVIPGDAVKDFPKLEELNGEEGLTISKKELKIRVDKALGFIDKNSDSVLRTLLFSTEEEGLSIYATNRHICYKSNLECSGTIGRISVDTEISKMLAIMEGEEVSLKVNGFKFQLSDSSITTIGTLMAEKYPPAERYFEDIPELTLTLNRAQVGGTLKKAAIFSNHVTKEIRLHFNGDLKLSSKDLDYNRSFDSCMSYEADAEVNLLVGFNIQYLLTALNINTEEEVVLIPQSPSTPFYIQGSHTDMALVLPIMLTD